MIFPGGASEDAVSGRDEQRPAQSEIKFDRHLPLTRSVKVMRRLLRAGELGPEAGEVSAVPEAR